MTDAKPTLDGGWRPISEAPKDGTHVIVCVADEIVGEAHYYAEDEGHEGWYWMDQHWTDACGGEPIQPQAWQPLPKPPGSNETRR